VKPRAVRTLGDRRHAPYGHLGQDRVSHRTLVVRKECAVFSV
jgi:hypothetical protein